MKRTTTVTALATGAILLAGCSNPSGGGGSASPTETASPAASPTATTPSALSGFLCSPDENGVWRGKARLTNVGTATNTYTVRFSVIQTGSQDVLGMKEESFTVAPGVSTDVAIASIHTSNAKGLECVARVIAEPAAPAESPDMTPEESPNGS
ncbi:hypothetical protein [Arthrobacter sp. NPDC089319]|uniref:hypothetical protein n=1 Tax=Arthrobacter sp. NPDC089319 TaxID=3155915 RepID=UPI003414E9B6